MFNWLSRWRMVAKSRNSLDTLLDSAKPDAPLPLRLEWLVELFRWVRLPGSLPVPKQELQTGKLQITRMRFLLLQLDKNLELKAKVAATLRSILIETKSLNLFSTTGLPVHAGFFAEAIDRIVVRVLPRPPHTDDLGEVFIRVFSEESDLLWLMRAEEGLFKEIWDLFHFGPHAESEKLKIKMREEIEDAIIYLIGQIQAAGLSPSIRLRTSKMTIRQSPFYRLSLISGDLISYLKDGSSGQSKHNVVDELRQLISECRYELDLAHKHLDVYGVSVNIVHQLDRIDMNLKRLDTLTGILSEKDTDPGSMLFFLATLVYELRERQSFRSFLSENLSLLSMKIAEQNAETGEHYIARNKIEYKKMLRKASAGGVFAGFVSFTKVFLEEMGLSYFLQGLIKSANYSIGFLGIYFTGATLATRQPAMTANALASKMKNVSDDEERSDLVDEVVYLFRSQAAAIFGNILLVVPTALLTYIVYFEVLSSPLMSQVEAMETFSKYSVLGLTPLYAAFTGVLLWASSVFAGWAQNWSIYHEIPQALAAKRGLEYVLGPTRLKRWISFYQRHLCGVAGYVSLGIFLGMSPKIFGFIGIPFDVRHVTISTGTIALASVSLGSNFYMFYQFWMAIAGVIVVGVLNVGVSFYLAFWVALKSRRISSSMRNKIYADVFARFKRNPFLFVFPVFKDQNKN